MSSVFRLAYEWELAFQSRHSARHGRYSLALLHRHILRRKVSGWNWLKPPHSY